MEPVVHAANGAAVPHGNSDPVRQLPVELLRNLKRNGLFSLRKDGVDARVAVIPAIFFNRCLGKIKRCLIVSFDGHHLCAEDHELRHLAFRCALRHKNDRFEPHARGVARAGRCSVARGRTGDGIIAQLHRFCNRYAGSAVFQGSRGVQAVILDIKCAEAKLSPKAVGWVQRRPTHAQEARKIPWHKRHQRRIAPHAVRAVTPKRFPVKFLFYVAIIENDIQNALFTAMRAGHAFIIWQFCAAKCAAVTQYMFHLLHLYPYCKKSLTCKKSLFPCL